MQGTGAQFSGGLLAQHAQHLISINFIKVPFPGQVLKSSLSHYCSPGISLHQQYHQWRNHCSFGRCGNCLHFLLHYQYNFQFEEISNKTQLSQNLCQIKEKIFKLLPISSTMFKQFDIVLIKRSIYFKTICFLLNSDLRYKIYHFLQQHL